MARIAAEQSSTFERLASGQRITRASDDAAGLAISSSLNLQGRVFTQAIRNVNDGLSLLGVAEGALMQLADIANRQMELASQAANGTYSSKQRLALQRESDALVSEHNRIIQSTSFNERQLLDGSFGALTIQQGFGTSQTTTLRLGEALSPAAGDGTFSVVATLANPGGGAIDSAVADLNGDGISDIVIGSQAGAGSVYLGSSNGSYSLGGALPISGSALYRVELGDVNGDDRPDIVAIGYNTPNSLFLFLNNGQGSFGSAVSFNIPQASLNLAEDALKLADFNSDGNLDIVSQSDLASTAFVSLGNGDGTFRRSAELSTVGTGVITGDFNNDGIIDILTQGQGGIGLSFRRGNGDGTFFTAITATGSSGFASQYTSGDFNHDGNLDIVENTLGNSSANKIHFGTGNGTFTTGTSFGGSFWRTDIQSGDINGDGYLDIIASARGAGYSPDASTEVYLNNGNGTFRSGLTIAEVAGSQTWGGTLKDLNNDGVLDFITSSFEAGILRVFRGNVDSTGRRNPLLEKFDFLGPDSARDGLISLTGILNTISAERGQIGAMQARLGASLGVLRTPVGGLAAAESRILDVDMASEAALLARQAIVLRAGAAVLAQANLQPTLALRLLQS